jgi:hypothetical protein
MLLSCKFINSTLCNDPCPHELSKNGAVTLSPDNRKCVVNKLQGIKRILRKSDLRDISFLQFGRNDFSAFRD